VKCQANTVHAVAGGLTAAVIAPYPTVGLTLKYGKGWRSLAPLRRKAGGSCDTVGHVKEKPAHPGDGLGLLSERHIGLTLDSRIEKRMVASAANFR